MNTFKIIKISIFVLIVACTVSAFSGCVVNGKVIGLSDYYYDDAENYAAGEAELNEKVENIEIDWPVGSVTVLPHDLDTVCLSEKSERKLTDNTKLHYWLKDTTLRIKFLACGKWDFGDVEKELTVLVPETLVLSNFKVNTLSANVDLKGCAVTRSVEVNKVSGELNAELTQPLNEFKGDSTSRKFTISAPSVSRLDVGTVSGGVSLTAQKEPDFLDVDTTSGSISLTIPESASFALDYDTTSGDLSSDISFKKSAGKYVFGDGKGEYKIGTVSGNVKISANEVTK